MHLNYRIIVRILGILLLILGSAMLPSIIAAFIYGEPGPLRAFVLSSVILISSGIAVTLKVRPGPATLRLQEGYIIVALCWLSASVLGAAPYLLSGVTGSFADALFDSTAGFTTTGATVFDVLNFPKSLLLWKAVSHLLGGMGILVFAISILPALGVGGQKIYKAEAPGPTADKVASRTSDSARILYLTYLVFGFVEFIMLSFSPMSLFDALIHTFGSISTSGLTNHIGGLSYYNSIYIEAVISVFCILASINFTLYAHVMQGKWKDFFSNTELRVFLLTMIAAALLVSVALYACGTYESVADSLRFGVLQVISIATTSGHAVVDFMDWPDFCKALLFILMFIGGCAASTCGSIKVIRVAVMFKLIVRGIKKSIHPRRIIAVKLGGRAISAETVSKIASFILTYLAIFAISNIVLSLQNLDFITTVSASASLLSNTGCIFGPAESGAPSFSLFAAPLKLYLSLLMIVGRLELFTVLVLFSPKLHGHRS